MERRLENPNEKGSLVKKIKRSARKICLNAIPTLN